MIYMYTIDSRDRSKPESELIRDRQTIIKALTEITGYTMFSYYENNVHKQTFASKGTILKVADVTLVEESQLSPSKGIQVYKRVFLPRTVVPVSYTALAYGDVAYIREMQHNGTSTLYVQLNGKTLLTVSYTEVVDLWEFSLYFQDSLKQHTTFEFIQLLRQDKNFYKK